MKRLAVHGSGWSKGRAGMALMSGVAGMWLAAGLTGCALDRKGEGDQAAPPAPVTQAPARPAPPMEAPATKGRAPFKLGKPERPRDWDHARLQAAQRLIAANPEGTYMGKPPPILLAIPVLTIELNGDGTVRNVSVMRYPSQARDTVKTAIDAVHRAAPYGDVSRLPKPWKFNETFLFRDDRRFKPMTLDRR